LYGACNACWLFDDNLAARGAQPGISSSMATVSLHALRKAYGANAVVHDVSLAIEDQEFVVLVGPSGCGKSTILRMIAGLEDITSGEIRIDGQVVNERDPKDRDIAMVFQDYALYPHMTVADNMAFSLLYRRASRAEIGARVADAATILDIVELLQRYPRQLSGGQRQRVAMGRAIVRDPKVFLFDEPLSNLDAKLRVAMRTEIKRLRERVRTTTVYVTHDQVEAMTLADRIVVLNGGRIEQIGTPEEVYDRPATQFVAGFIGAPPMNLVPARVLGGPTPSLEIASIRIPMPKLPSQMQATDVVAGIRPEHLEWAASGMPPTLVAPAAVVEPLGSDTLVAVQLGAHVVQARLPPKLVRHVGDKVSLRMAPENIHLFETGGPRIAP
jgi:ABC-type sugar transport system ATPase subunit